MHDKLKDILKDFTLSFTDLWLQRMREEISAEEFKDEEADLIENYALKIEEVQRNAN